MYSKFDSGNMQSGLRSYADELKEAMRWDSLIIVGVLKGCDCFYNGVIPLVNKEQLMWSNWTNVNFKASGIIPYHLLISKLER